MEQVVTVEFVSKLPANIIHHVNTEKAVPIVLVSKKDGLSGFGGYYHKLNDVTTLNA